MSTAILFQRLEGAAIFGVALLAYAIAGYDWIAFVGLLFIFDVSMFGYLVNTKWGAVIYNIGHALVLPALLLGVWIVTNAGVFLLLSLIWFAHIGLDRALGYGLKLSKGFRHTHLGEIGKGSR